MIYKITRIAFRKVLESKLLNLFLMLQVFIVIIVINISIGRIQHSNYVTNIINNSHMTNAYYFMPRFSTRLSLDSGEGEAQYKQIFSSLNYTDSIGTIKKYDFFSEVNYDIDVMAYNKDLIKKLRLPLSAGKWFNQSTLQMKEYVPVIISDTLSNYYHLNDIIQIKGVNSNHKLKVIGILDPQGYFLSFKSAGDYMTVNDMFEKNSNIIICPDNESLDNDKIGGYEQGKIIFIDKDASSIDVKSELNSKLRDIGYLSSIKEMIINQNESNSRDVILQFVHTIIALILALAGIGGNNALSLIFQEKEFAIYFMCGLKWKWCVCIVVIKNIIMLFIPVTASIFVLKMLNAGAYGNNLIINMNNYILTFLVICGIYFITSFGTILRMHNESPINIIRRWD